MVFVVDSYNNGLLHFIYKKKKDILVWQRRGFFFSDAMASIFVKCIKDLQSRELLLTKEGKSFHFGVIAFTFVKYNKTLEIK